MNSNIKGYVALAANVLAVVVSFYEGGLWAGVVASILVLQLIALGAAIGGCITMVGLLTQVAAATAQAFSQEAEVRVELIDGLLAASKEAMERGDGVKLEEDTSSRRH